MLGTGLILTPLNGFKLGTWLRKKPFTLMLETYAFASQTDNAPHKAIHGAQVLNFFKNSTITYDELRRCPTLVGRFLMRLLGFYNFISYPKLTIIQNSAIFLTLFLLLVLL